MPRNKQKSKPVTTPRPKNHCIICRIANASEELRKHRNGQTIAIVELLLRRKEQKLLKDIKNLCPNHISGSKEYVNILNFAIKQLRINITPKQT